MIERSTHTQIRLEGNKGPWELEFDISPFGGMTLTLIKKNLEIDSDREVFEIDGYNQLHDLSSLIQELCSEVMKER